MEMYYTKVLAKRWCSHDVRGVFVPILSAQSGEAVELKANDFSSSHNCFRECTGIWFPEPKRKLQICRRPQNKK
jgi:hypothetical protein